MFPGLVPSSVVMTRRALGARVSAITSQAHNPPRVALVKRRAVFLHVTVTWMSGAQTTCPGPVSTAQALASVDRDKLQRCLT